jgi:hypothetical protein
MTLRSATLRSATHVDTPSLDPQGSFTLSIHRAFVVRLYADLDLAHGRASGQIEHVVTGEGSEFHSVDELLRFMNRVLDRRQAKDE